MNKTMMISQLDFSKALEGLKAGLQMQRVGWNGKGMYLAYYSPAKEHPQHADNFATSHGVYPLHPFIFMKTADNMLVPWSASQTDLLAEDWSVVV